MTEEELRDILGTARTFNPSQGITGMLLYRDRFFIQVLEGEQEPVEALFKKIARDPRHMNVLMVYNSPIEKRSFEKWSMGFNHLGKLTPEEAEAYTDYLKEPFTMSSFTDGSGRATNLLNSFKNKTYF
jgi:hypothetical protein